MQLQSLLSVSPSLRLSFHQNPHSASESDIMLLTKQVDKQGLIAATISPPSAPSPSRLLPLK